MGSYSWHQSPVQCVRLRLRIIIKLKSCYSLPIVTMLQGEDNSSMDQLLILCLQPVVCNCSHLQETPPRCCKISIALFHRTLQNVYMILETILAQLIKNLDCSSLIYGSNFCIQKLIFDFKLYKHVIMYNYILPWGDTM